MIRHFFTRFPVSQLTGNATTLQVGTRVRFRRGSRRPPISRFFVACRRGAICRSRCCLRPFSVRLERADKTNPTRAGAHDWYQPCAAAGTLRRPRESGSTDWTSGSADIGTSGRTTKQGNSLSLPNECRAWWCTRSSRSRAANGRYAGWVSHCSRTCSWGRPSSSHARSRATSTSCLSACAFFAG
jgi:hypothetical protein